MPPNLEGMMFNRNANLSTRKPLLPDEPRVRLASAVGQRDDVRRPYGGPEPHRAYHPGAPPTPRLDYPRDVYTGQYPYRGRDEYGTTTFIEDRYPRNGYGRTGKVAYFKNKHTFGIDDDRRETELVFRFDPHSSRDHLGSDDAPRIDQYTSGLPSNGRVADGSSGPGEPRKRPPDKDGPFVFGVHSPSQFKIPSRISDEDYDYAIVEEYGSRTVIRNERADRCDRVNDWNARNKARTRRTLNRMFQIKDNRKSSVKLEQGSERKGKKDKIKCVLVGDGAVGKTSLITAYAQNKFRSEYEPTAYDNFNVMVEVDDRPVCVEICDTAGQESMSELRALCYPGTDVLVLCFSVVRPETFRSVAGRWARAAAGLRAPVVLVGTQADLAHDPDVLRALELRGEHAVTEAEARVLASSINAEYIETSAKTRTKLKDAFDSAILAALPVIASKKPCWKKFFCIN